MEISPVSIRMNPPLPLICALFLSLSAVSEAQVDKAWTILYLNRTWWGGVPAWPGVKYDWAVVRVVFLLGGALDTVQEAVEKIFWVYVVGWSWIVYHFQQAGKAGLKGVFSANNDVCGFHACSHYQSGIWHFFLMEHFTKYFNYEMEKICQTLNLN